METFKIRTYGRMELAQMYNPCMNPHSAYRKFIMWIELCPNLRDRLMEMGHNPRKRTYTPLQVKAIIEALGEP